MGLKLFWGLIVVEAVRLLIWDLDDTFWKGTLTEGGIESIPEETIAVVRTLNRRGIMNSICSKNDKRTTQTILKDLQINEEFIFPSIEWSSKGIRILNIIKAIGFRPQSVMFIDDNPSVRAEAAAIVRGLQIEDERFVPHILSDERFVGKPDKTLSRLKHYKVLEAKASDQVSGGMSNEQFLRQSGIELMIDYDLEGKFERIVELINRTNQLNYTKRRLPEDEMIASSSIRSWSNAFNIQAGLVNVRDKYGDYGAVGFFMQTSVHETVDGRSRGELLHYCFSCRTLGMLVEQWVYVHLGRPKLSIVGEVLTDLNAKREVDWITLVDSFDGSSRALEPSFSKITLYGGCEANAIAVYLQAKTKELHCYGNYSANGCFVRVASAVQAVNMCDVQPEAVREVAERLRLPLSRLANNIFEQSPEGSVFVFNCSSGDAGGGDRYFRHKTSGLALHIEPPSMPGLHFMTTAKDEILTRVATEQRDIIEYISSAYDYINTNFELIEKDQCASRLALLRLLVDRVPAGCKMLILSDHDYIRTSETEIMHLPWFTQYAQDAREIAAEFDFCDFISFSDMIDGEGDIQMHGNHYNREVYLRMANRISEFAARLKGRS